MLKDEPLTKMYTKPDKVTVVRSRWSGRDGYKGDSCLLSTEHGDMCCLGFYCEASTARLKA
jgi:hypothetical protein